MTWIDATLQQILAARQLLEMAKTLNRDSDITDIKTEYDFLTQFTNQRLWDENTAFYFDRWRNGELSKTKSIGAYWALLADIVPPERQEKFIAHLRNPQEFNRPHRVPSLAADHPNYTVQGDYWRGSVWPPTNYMLLRGLSQVNENVLAHEIALNHLKNVTQVFRETGTLWENYAPEKAAPGKPAKDDFVGWSGLGPIAVLFEYVFGIRADVPKNQIVWDVRLLEEHGVKQYPFGTDGLLDLHCESRESENEEPQITVTSNVPVTIFVRWAGQQKSITV
jgi:glycogen debranching enzyme